ncbi:class I adenylate-forming enzyme family protein [Solicola gregarius]|uniref:AMP-binding protein n=1 Tax=Solicola gregarius TaxID=2908642 RepID=A0AA46YLR9_9ACTN|nr:AMP-binding protein [Solicola gregarius]UYM06942.1 AMP-binding protein [Solicola gregarius]
MTIPTVNVSALASERAQVGAGDLALIESFGEGRTMAWGELDELTTTIARAFAGSGLVAGHRVALAMTNRIEFVATYLGALRGGHVVVPMNPWSATGELMRMLADSGSRVVVCDEVTVDNVRAAVGGLAAALDTADDGLRARASVPTIVVVGGYADVGETAFESYLDNAPDIAVASPSDPEALAALLYTSGTSGNPRGVMLSHRALLADIEQVGRIEPEPITSKDVVLGLLPLFHIYGLNVVLGQVLRTGARLVLVRRFDHEETLDIVAEHGVTNIPIAPPVVAAWAGRGDLRTKLESVELVLSGAAPLDHDLTDLFVESGGVVIEQGYGLTEAAPVITSTLTARGREPDGSPKAGSVGAPVPGLELRVLDGSRREAQPGDPGEIWVRGANLFSGYWPDGREAPQPDGWYATGDVGVVDRDGDLSLVDRLRELVIVSGFNVYPSEVEDVIVELDEIAEAAVIGVPDGETGEAVQAFVVPADDRSSVSETVDRVRSHCESRLARFKWPKHVTVTTDLPHSANGKVAKGRLRAQARRESLGLS